MANSYDQIVTAIDEHLQKSGKRYYSEFYIGVASNASKKLFEEHHVNKENSWWIFRTASTPAIANKVKEHYLNLGMRGRNGENNSDAMMVYCYAVTLTTTE